MNRSEPELLQQLIAGDESAFRYLIEREQEHILRVCIGFLHNREDAEDIAQDVFIELIRSLENFRGEASISTWLYRIAVNKSLNFLQKRKRERLILSLQELIGLKEPQSKQQPVQQLELKEQQLKISQAIDSLPENQRIAYTLVKYDDLSYQEVAEIMNISHSSVESLMFRAKSKLQKKLLNFYKEN